jgi:hypothetical protein
MAKLKVKQIEDLAILTADGTNIKTIQIGPGTENSVKPLLGVSTTEGENSVAGGYISGLSVSGNEIVITRTALPELTITGNGENDGDFVLNAAVDTTNKHKINLTKGTFDVSTGTGEPAQIGSLIFGNDNILKVNETWVKSFIGDGKLKVQFGTETAAETGFSANATSDATLTFAKVASTGKAADVSIADTGNLITATTVEGALAEIAAEIDAMDLTATDVVALNTGKTALQAGKISESDGKVAVATAETLVEFNQAISSTNKVATMADVTAAAVSGQDAIVVGDAPQGSTTGKVVSLKIKSDDKILDQTAADGLFSTLSLTYDAAAQADGKKYIRLKGKDNTDISKIDATDFIKDGMLADAVYTELTEGQVEGQAAGKYIVLTFNTDSGKTPVYVNVTALVDTYTAKANDWIELDDHEFSHKPQGAFTQGEGQNAPQTTFGDNGEDDITADAAGESVEFKVPSFTVDAAGHVTAASEKTVKVELPAAPTTTTKKVYTPKEQKQTGNGVFNVGAGATHFRMYMNGQLLDSTAYTVGETTVTYNPTAYVALEETDRMDLVYFIEEEITVFAPATQEPAE